MSLSEPYIDHDNGPCTRNNGTYLCTYVSMYHLPSVCRTLVPEIHVCPKMLHVIRYIDVLMCMIYNCMYSTEQQGRLELLVSAMKIIDKDR